MTSRPSKLYPHMHLWGLLATLVGLALLACADHTLDSKNEQTEIHDPWPDEDAELLALFISGQVVAPRAMYETIHADLESIHNEWCGSIGVLCAMHPRESTLVGILNLTPDESTYDVMVAGDYDAWDELNAYYHLDTVVFAGREPWPGVPGGRYRVSLYFKPRLNTRLLISEYSALPGVLDAYPWTLSSYGSELIGSIQSNGERMYQFVLGWGDCPAGCIHKHTWTFRATGNDVYYMGESGSPYESIFRLSRQPGLGFCPEIDEIFRLSIDLIFPQGFVLSGTILRGFEEPRDDCREFVFGEPVCLVEERIGLRYLAGSQVLTLDSLVAEIPEEDVPIDPGCDPCLVTEYRHRGERIVPHPCAFGHSQEYWDAIDAIEDYLFVLATLRQ